jgi:hypothetical protein
MQQTQLEVAQRRFFLSGRRNSALDDQLAANSAAIAELNQKLQQL